MLKKLQKIYATIIPFDPQKSESYQWFLSENGDIFGIHQRELSEKDIQILTTFLRKYEPNIPERTATEQLWFERVTGKSDKPVSHAFRFIYFSMQKNQTEPGTFREAIHTLFERGLPILWIDETKGVIIEDILPADEEIHLEQFIHILMADLSVDLRFYIGTIHDDADHLPAVYDDVTQKGEQIFQLTNKKVIHEMEAIPYLIVHQLPEQDKQKLSSSILQHFQEDEEMLATLKTFFAANLNISETAKNMYMHRNSLQYRLDKFSKETGINVQSFSEAVTVHLALLAKKGL